MACVTRALRGVRSIAEGGEALERSWPERDCPTASAGDGDTEAALPHRVVASHALQPVVLTRPMLLPELYRRVTGPADVDEREDGLFLPASGSVDFDAFVNVFFEWHWLRCTGHTADALELEVEGVGDVGVIRTLRDGQIERLAAQPISTGRTRVAIPLPSRAPGTLSFAVEARSADGLTIKSAVWTTRAAPRGAVSVDIVICTFNKLDMLRASLDALCRLGLPTAGIRRAIVVDQGSDRLMADGMLGTPARRAMASGRLVVFEQPNLGGAGGFTRGIVEALSIEDRSACTHVLLMDDDVVFEPRLLSRLVAFLGRLPADAVVGGSMLDMMHPHHMFAYSERFNHRTAHCERLQPRDLDLRERRHIELEDGPTGNYNGWFLCCFPRSVFEAYGLPLPLFVRSDDCEFGLRLSNRGVPLIHMPAFFVWHEPFWLKRRAWMEVYTLRNHLIVASVSSEGYDWRLALRRFGEFWYYIGTYQYEVAYACCMALEGFLEGPTSVFDGVLGRHRSIMAEISGFEEALRLGFSVSRSGSCPQRGARPKSSLYSLLPQFVRWPLNILWNLRGRTSRPVPGAEAHQAVPQDRLSWDSFHLFPVVLVDLADGQTSLARYHDAAVARLLTARMLRLVARLLWSGKRLRNDYIGSLNAYRSGSFWEKTFAPFRQLPPRPFLDPPLDHRD